jgi:hypothetical protein
LKKVFAGDSCRTLRDVQVVLRDRPERRAPVLSTVGHIAQMAIVNSAAGCDFSNSTRPERQPGQRRDRAAAPG